MYKWFIIMLLAGIFMGCQPAGKQSPTAITIDKISFTAAEFEEAYQKSMYAKKGTPDSRQEFLETFITSKLILLAAENEGLDKDPGFLKDVEFFWQQSLIKLTLERQSQKLTETIEISEKEIKDYYDIHKAKYFNNKPLKFVKKEIQSVLMKMKQKAAYDDWIYSLKEEVDVDIQHALLGVESSKKKEAGHE